MEILRKLLCLFQVISILSLNQVTAEPKTLNIYLNSYTHCGHEKTYEVSLNNEYLIQPDISPDTGTNSFRKCEVSFHSHRDDGHICLIQEGNEAEILDNNAELLVYDGLGNAEDVPMGRLRPHPDIWAKRDICTKTRYITFYMREIDKLNSANIRKIHFTFRVVDIRSHKRTLYLDGTYCNSEYDLLDSQISLINRPLFPGMLESSLSSECAMKFQKVETNANSSICMVYIPSANVTCSSNWRFVISSADYDIDEKFILYDLHCYDSKANELHVWCGSVDHSFVTVVLQRDSRISSKSSIEPSRQFRFMVADYEGSPDGFLEKVRESLLMDNQSMFGTVEIILLCVCIILLIILIAIVYINRKKCPCYNYKSVETRDPEDENGEHRL